MTIGEKFIEHLMKSLRIHFNNRKLADYSNSTRWTNIMTNSGKKPKSLIDNALDSSGISRLASNEYYRIDNLRYSRNQKNPASKKSTSNINYRYWILEAAIEHENKWYDWTDELVKLAYINCPLRVVISYGNPTNNYDDCIKIANEIANDIDFKKYIGDEDEFLLVFGPRLKFIKDKKNVAELFRTFIWKDNKFIYFVTSFNIGIDNHG